jgi:hypothetical protein
MRAKPHTNTRAGTEPAEHGLDDYRHHIRHCPVCTEAWRAYCAEQQAARDAALQAPPRRGKQWTGPELDTTLTGHTAPVTAVTAVTAVAAVAAVPLPAERTLLASAGNDATVRLWDPQCGQPVGHPLTGHTAPVTAVPAVPLPWLPEGGAAADDRPRIALHPQLSGRNRGQSPANGAAPGRAAISALLVGTATPARHAYQPATTRNATATPRPS